MARRRTCRARRCDRRGFTLTEVIIALAILAVVVGVVMTVQLQSLKAARAAEAGEVALGPLERLIAGRAAGVDPRQVTAELRSDGWAAEADLKGGGGEALWEEWRLSPTGQPWMAISVCLTPVVPGTGRP